MEDSINYITDRIPVTQPTLVRYNAESEAMQQFLNAPANLVDPNMLAERLNILTVYIARVSEMLTKAKAMKEMAKNSYLDNNDSELSKLKATAKAQKIKTYIFEFDYITEKLSNQYSAMCCISRSLITQISYIKLQMSLQ